MVRYFTLIRDNYKRTSIFSMNSTEIQYNHNKLFGCIIFNVNEFSKFLVSRCYESENAKETIKYAVNDTKLYYDCPIIGKRIHIGHLTVQRAIKRFDCGLYISNNNNVPLHDAMGLHIIFKANDSSEILSDEIVKKILKCINIEIGDGEINESEHNHLINLWIAKDIADAHSNYEFYPNYEECYSSRIEHTCSRLSRLNSELNRIKQIVEGIREQIDELKVFSKYMKKIDCSSKKDATDSTSDFEMVRE